MTREQIQALISKKNAEKQKALVEAKRVQRQPIVRKPVVQKSVLEQRKEEAKRVLAERMLQPGQPKTLSEAVSQGIRTIEANKKVKLTEDQAKMYKDLAENMYKAQATLSEATQAGPGVTGVTNNAAGVGLMRTYFDIFFGYFPNLIVPMVASVQPIKMEKASVFFYQSVAGSTKGSVTKGDVLIDAFQVNTDQDFTADLVGLPSAKVVSYNSGAKAVWGPVIPRSVQIEGATLTWATDTTFTGSLIDEGTTIAITNGLVAIANDEITVSFTLASEASRPYAVKYMYDNKYAPTQIPELEANVDTREIQARMRTIKTNFSFQAGIGFEAQFGKKLDAVLADHAMFQLKRETDLDFVFEIMKSAPVTVKWNRAAGAANGLFKFHKEAFRDAIYQAANYIFKVSKRVSGNVLLVGVNALTILQTLEDFKGTDAGAQLKGAAVVGKLGSNIKVIVIPELGENEWAVIYKSETDNVDAGIIFAPYIPVMATTPVTLDDLVIRRAYVTSYGKLVVNPNYFVRGLIVNNPMALPVALVSKDGTETALLSLEDGEAVIA